MAVSTVTPMPPRKMPRNMATYRNALMEPPYVLASNSSTLGSTLCWRMRSAMVLAAWSSSWLPAGAMPTFSFR